MDRAIRRKDRVLSAAQTEDVLRRAEYGVLATVCEDGTPHAVPLSFVWQNGCIYFHCATSGLKLECIAHSPSICFTASVDVKAEYTKDFTTRYKSCVLYGKARLVDDPDEKIKALEGLCLKYLPASMDKFAASMKSLPVTAVVKLTPERITGKGNVAEDTQQPQMV